MHHASLLFRISNTPLSKSRRSDSRAYTTEFTKRHPGSGDWSPLSRRRLDDSDDDSLGASPINRGLVPAKLNTIGLKVITPIFRTMSCPPYRQPLRSRFRSRPIPRLDFSRVSNSPESCSSPATNTDSTASSFSSTTRHTKQQTHTKHSRMVSTFHCHSPKKI